MDQNRTQCTLSYICKEETKKTEQNTLEIVKYRQSCPLSNQNKNYEPRVVARSLSARIVGEDPSSEPLPDVSGLLGLSFLHSMLALQVSRWREALLSLGRSLHRVVQVHLGVFISTTLLRSPSACVIRAHLPNNIKSDQALNKKKENSTYKKKINEPLETFAV